MFPLTFAVEFSVLHLLPVLLVFGAVLSIVPLLVYLERKICAMIQDRSGPNRVGLLGPDGLMEAVTGMRITNSRVLGGLLQPLADAIKLITKEDFLPAKADKYLYTLAPFFALLPPLLTFVVIPVGLPLDAGWTNAAGGVEYLDMQVANLGIGVLWILAVASLSAYGIQLGGWASNSKFSLLGGIRATAQMVSYEIALGITLLSMFMYYGGSVLLGDMQMIQAGAKFAANGTIESYANGIGGWGLFHQPLAFLLFVICAYAENNRLPFDMAECEAELVGGFHTEYSSMKFGMFFQGEYIAMVSMGALTAALFLGGGHFPFANVVHQAAPWAATALSLVAFAVKVMLWVCIQIWVRWTLPRFRYDQVMSLGWKYLIPFALANMVLTAALQVL